MWEPNAQQRATLATFLSVSLVSRKFSVVRENDRKRIQNIRKESEGKKKERERVDKFCAGDKQKVVVNNLALTVGKTECLALIGPNGSGKTTFIKYFLSFLFFLLYLFSSFDFLASIRLHPSPY
jgi:ABC-type polysaccharide/polyol phosphate transport system ATPase subunit